MTLQGYALRMRWLWYSRTDQNTPWSSLPQKSEILVEAMFAASVTVEVGNGMRSYFWTVRELCVAQGSVNNGWALDITGALTVQVIIDYLLVWDIIRQSNVTLNLDVQDRFKWKWTADGQFTTASACKAFFNGQHALPGAKVLTKRRAPGRRKFFLWLVMHDRCWTGARRKRHNLQDEDNCTFCDQHAETISHLLSGCVLARETWYTILRRCNLQRLTPSSTALDFVDWCLLSRKHVRKELRKKAFDSLVALVTWSIWKERNQRIFQKKKLTVVNELIALILDEAPDDPRCKK
jgi:hypothetical protein